MPTVDPDETSVAEANALFLQSSLREKLLEHLFIGQLLQALWRAGRRDIEVLRTEVDSGGYDLVLECSGATRHVQLKSSHRRSSTRSVNISLALGRKPSGCVIWIEFDAATLDLGPFYWLGGSPGVSVPLNGYKNALHTRRGRGGIKHVRPGLVSVPRGRFELVLSLDDLIQRLFGSAL